MGKLKLFSGKLRQSIESYLNQNLVIRSFFGNGFEATLSWKVNVLSVWKAHLSTFEKCFFQVFRNCWLAKLKAFPGKVRQSVQNCLNQNLVVRSFLKNGFEDTLSTKMIVLCVWKGHFSFSWNFLSDEVETIFWESEAKRSKLFISEFGHRKPLRKFLLSYLHL